MRIPMPVVLGQWRPDQCRQTGYLPVDGIKPHLKETHYSTRIQVDTIIVWSDRKAYQVAEITERPLDLWPEHFRTEWKRYTEWWVEQVMAGRDMGAQPEQATWKHRPVVLALQPADQPNAKPQHYAVRADRSFYVLPEHYSVCRLCNEIPPCTHVTTEAVIDHEMGKTERLMAIPAGGCLACGEQITKRQKSFTFPGPNLLRPDLGDDSAVFHTRAACSDAMSSYDKRWAAAEQGRDRLFFCEGTLTTHHDGSSECDNPGCVAKGEHAKLVDHRLRIWHHPGDRAARAASHVDPSAPGCWCLAAA